VTTGLLGGGRGVGGGRRFRGFGFGRGFGGAVVPGRRALGRGPLGLARGGLLRGRAAGRLGVLGGGEFILLYHGRARRRGLAFQHRVGGGGGVQLHRADGVVVAGDRVVDQRRIVVGVDHRDHRDAQLAGFLDGDVL